MYREARKKRREIIAEEEEGATESSHNIVSMFAVRFELREGVGITEPI